MTRSSAAAAPSWQRSATDVEHTAKDLIGSSSLSSSALGRYLQGLPGVDQVGAEARAAMLSTRSIKTSSKAWALEMAIKMMDLTTLEGADTPGKVRAMVAKARTPEPGDPSCPSPAAVCVYNDLVPAALEAVAGTAIKVAAVSTAFPSGRASRAVRLADTTDAVDAGAHEIDMVIDRGAFLTGDYARVFEDIARVREVCHSRRGPGGEPDPAHLKVILETGELATYDNVRRASWLAMLAGADFIKTSTGKVSPAATLPVTILMLEAVRDYLAATGVQIGVKPAGGIRTSKDAIRYLVAVHEVAGEPWLDPDYFRFGASSLLNDVLRQRQKLTTGVYSGSDYVTID